MDNIIEKERSVCYHKIRREGNGKYSGTGAKPHSAVSSFQNGAARTAQGTAPMAPPLFGAEFIRRRQKTAQKSASFQNAFSARAGQGLRDTVSQHTQCCVRH